MKTPEIYVSISTHSSDITAWLVIYGHAFPFDDVGQAMGASSDIKPGVGPYASSDEVFRAEVDDASDRWWDRLPEADDSPSVAAVLAGRYSSGRY